jgi:hypothetical protein
MSGKRLSSNLCSLLSTFDSTGSMGFNPQKFDLNLTGYMPVTMVELATRVGFRFETRVLASYPPNRP